MASGSLGLFKDSFQLVCEENWRFFSVADAWLTPYKKKHHMQDNKMYISLSGNVNVPPHNVTYFLMWCFNV